MESLLTTRALETMVTPMINAPTPPAQIKDPRNLGSMMGDQGMVEMWDGELRNIPARRNDLANGMVEAYALL